MFCGLLIAPIGYVFTRILMEDLLIGYARLILRLPEWLNKPLGGCGVCFTGQASVWLLLPFVRWDYLGVLTYIGIVSINMIIVKFLIYAEKD